MGENKSIWDKIRSGFLSKKSDNIARPDEESSSGTDESIEDKLREKLVITKVEHDPGSLEQIKLLIRTIENDYSELPATEFYEKYYTDYLLGLFSDKSDYMNYLRFYDNNILGFLLVNILAEKYYILQMDYKDFPDELLPEYIEERLATDYGISVTGLDNLEYTEKKGEMYESSYVEVLQKILQNIGFRLVWFLLDNDQYYVAVVPSDVPLDDMWHEIELYY